MKSIRISYYHDPSHGWYRVSNKALRELGIADQISAFSYTNGASAYLEEDSDAGLLFDTLLDFGIVPTIHRCKQETRSRVRAFRSYQSARSAE